MSNDSKFHNTTECAVSFRIIKKQRRIKRKEEKNLSKIKFPPAGVSNPSLVKVDDLSPCRRHHEGQEKDPSSPVNANTLCWQTLCGTIKGKLDWKTLKRIVFLRKESHTNCLRRSIVSPLCGIYAVKAYSFLSRQREMLQVSADHPSAVRESCDGFSILGIVLTSELQEIDSNSKVVE